MPPPKNQKARKVRGFGHPSARTTRSSAPGNAPLANRRPLFHLYGRRAFRSVKTHSATPRIPRLRDRLRESPQGTTDRSRVGTVGHVLTSSPPSVVSVASSARSVCPGRGRPTHVAVVSSSHTQLCSHGRRQEGDVLEAAGRAAHVAKLHGEVHQLMTASMVHVTNLTPGGDNPSRAYGQKHPVGDKQYGPCDSRYGHM